METKEDIVIVGGGIAGLCVALGLHRLGFKALVLESYDTLRVTGAAFSAWTNAWKALDALGVGDSLRRDHTRMSRIIATSTELGVKTAEQSYGEHEVRCVKRQALLEALAKELPSNTIRYSSKLVNIEKSGYFKLLHLADGSILKTKVVIGCDGVNSVVARMLGFKKPSFTNRSAIRGYVVFKENHGLNSEFLQFMGHGKRYGILPCDAKSVYWFFTWTPSNEDEEIKASPVKMKQYVLNNLGIVQDKIKDIIEKTEVENILCSPLRFRLPWEIIWRDITKDNICIAGDALHSMTPDLGQGACSALEDGIVLVRCLAEGLSAKSSSESDDSEAEEYRKIETSLNKYAKERKWRGIDLITTAYIVGSMQQSSSKVVGFLRDKVLATFLMRMLLKKAEFDCDLGQGACSALEDGIVVARCLAEGFSAKSSIESEDSEYRNIETSLQKYAKERKWRVIDLVTTAYLIGAVQQSSWKFVGYFRDKVLANFLARLLFKKAGFDCGQLSIS